MYFTFELVDFEIGCINMVCAHVIFDGWSGGPWFFRIGCLGACLIFPALAEVPFGGCNRGFEIDFYIFRCHARPRCEMAVLGCFEQCGFYRAEKRGLQKCDGVYFG